MSDRSSVAPYRAARDVRLAAGGRDDGAEVDTRSPDQQHETVLSVAELDAQLRSSVRALGVLVIEGEVTGAKGANASGHVYFTLKDEREDASIACAMFRRDAQLGGGNRIVNGARVRVRGEATVYSPRGSLQLVVSRVAAAGEGDLLQRREALKRKLAAEGLFAPERKRAVPTDPKVVGVVTSRTGAVLHDIVKVAARRGAVRILLAPAAVQGDDAPRQLRAALAQLCALAEVDVIILGRGGGSAEDLAAFDDEGLARDIAASCKPVVAAVGHEVDWSIACMVADVRAATPSQAAELVVPDLSVRRNRLAEGLRRLTLSMRAQLSEDKTIVSQNLARLRAPERAMALHRQRLDELHGRSTAAMRARIAMAARGRLQLERRLDARHPRAILAEARGAIEPMRWRMQGAITRRIVHARSDWGQVAPTLERLVRQAIERRRARFVATAEKLDAISPLAVLARGYAIVVLKDDQGRREVLRHASAASVGATLELRLHSGTLEASVTSSRPTPGE